MPLTLTINPNDETPVYRQLYRNLRDRILTGDLLPGSRLPSSRTLSQQLGVARVTVTQAYDQLASEGFVESRSGSGTYVTQDLNKSDSRSKGMLPANQTLTAWGKLALNLGQDQAAGEDAGRIEIDFGLGRPFAEDFPYDVWRRLLAQYLSTDDAVLSRYGSAAGFRPLREALAGYLNDVRGVRCTMDQVIIVSGAQQALDILARLLLQPGDHVLLESPGYPDARTIFQLHQAELLGLPVDDDGLPVDTIPAEWDAKLVFVTPAHQFPRGGTMPLARRHKLIAWAAAHRAVIVEDDYDGDLRYDGFSQSALQGLDDQGRVVYLGTFSKVLFPALRLGYLVLPDWLVPPFVRAKDLVDRGAPTLTQAAMADFINEGHFERHIRRLRRLYGVKRAILVGELEKKLGKRVRYSPVEAGLHVLVYLEPGLEEAQAVHEAAVRGVRVYPGARFHLEHNPPASIILGFSGLRDEAIREGVDRLALAIDACRNESPPAE
ncbi:MAG: PLP-dependent aminotransferase family protein [Chloroflexota bacterium]